MLIMKTCRFWRRTAGAAVVLGLSTLALTATADGLPVNQQAWQEQAAEYYGPLHSSFGSPHNLIEADQIYDVTIGPNGMAATSGLTGTLDVVKGSKVYGFRITNQSNQPVPVMLKGMDKPIVVAMPGQNTYFAWSFDTWNTNPNALVLGSSSVPIYIGPEPYNT
ncbi:hypothetical protein LH435_02355 [Laribacter hongkongensis]|uniref:hypothetical protein n=1 Tax=Laribacter hongkongensis TaxID=168471 RepID=UPI001EFDD2C8|nr:hypothetical protein [Laribacter hongkongensis]MCG8994628.1 hypothetical protein [Laribacter hongkongensis]MCG9009411.1 hypothetical protein [Laribacter hongkongensis]MCG9021930.1 hypothetical protein [Laribacter hongkongensis]MCG9045697.1 hypothetical protein [Laribacter hongkongensis]MCG9072870.1 hypothetical protein [Laribacter hongkongensis]